jgi:hypothetical protein
MAGKKLRVNKRQAIENYLLENAMAVGYHYNKIVYDRTDKTEWLKDRGIDQCPDCKSWVEIKDDICDVCLNEPVITYENFSSGRNRTIY